MSKKLLSLAEHYLTRKISAEIKCCIIFFLILCFYCIYRWFAGFAEAGIIHMLEMVLLAYVMQWIQILLHSDFDEVDRLAVKEWLVIVVGSLIYMTVGYLGSWFNRSIGVGIAFCVYMVCAYLGTFLVYKIKRVIDAKHLNADLKLFHERRAKEESL